MKKCSAAARKNGRMFNANPEHQEGCPARLWKGKNGRKEEDLNKLLDCHLNWITRYPKLPHKRYLDKIIPYPEWFDGSGKRPEIIASEKLGIFCFKAVLSLMGGVEEDAALAMKEAEDFIGTPDILGMKEPYQVAFRYLVAANNALLAYRLKLYDKAKKEFEKTLQLDLTHTTTKGLLLAMRAAFLEYLGDVNASVFQLKAAVKLEPDVPEYLEWLYRSMRSIRRKHDIEKRSGPSPEEFELMEKAVLADPSEVYTNLSMVTLYRDILRTKANDAKYTCKTITDVGIPKIISGMKIYAGQVWQKRRWASDGMLYGQVLLYNELGIPSSKYCIGKKSLATAKVVFDICAKEFPHDAGVLHAVGRFRCLYSASPKDGVALLVSSLEHDPLNLEVLMDYFRFGHYALLKDELEEGKSIAQEYIERIDSLLEICASRKDDCPLFGTCTIKPKLLCLKATLLCKEHKFKEAIVCWIEALEMDPGIEHSKTFSIFGKGVFIELFQYEDYQLLLPFIWEGIEKISEMTNPAPGQVRALIVLKKLLEVI